MKYFIFEHRAELTQIIPEHETDDGYDSHTIHHFIFSLYNCYSR